MNTSLIMSLSHHRVAWYPMGLYNEQKRAKSRRLLYTVITVCLMAGTVALVVSWLLATGIIDPDQSASRTANLTRPRVGVRPAKKLDVFSDKNAIRDYPPVVKTGNNPGLSEEIRAVITGNNLGTAEVETVTEQVEEVEEEEEQNTEAPVIVAELEMEDYTDTDPTMELNQEARAENILEENFQVSAEDESEEEPEEITMIPEDTEMTTIQTFQ